MTKRSKTYKHPRFPFIEVHIETREGQRHIYSTVDGDALNHAYLDNANSPLAECVASSLRHAEQTFFYEGGGAFYHWRGKVDEAAQSGDMDALCALAEGRGYWSGIRAAIEQVRCGSQDYVSNGVPLFESKLLPSNLYPERAGKSEAAPCEDAVDDDILF